MSRDELIAKHANELTGFCLEAFLLVATEEQRKVTSPGYSAARKGEFMIEQMKRVREFLGRIYDSLPDTKSLSDKEKELQETIEKLKLELARPRKLDEVIADAKALNHDERSKFRTWFESLPKPPGPTTTKPSANATGGKK